MDKNPKIKSVYTRPKSEGGPENIVLELQPTSGFPISKRELYQAGDLGSQVDYYRTNMAPLRGSAQGVVARIIAKRAKERRHDNTEAELQKGAIAEQGFIKNIAPELIKQPRVFAVLTSLQDSLLDNSGIDIVVLTLKPGKDIKNMSQVALGLIKALQKYLTDEEFISGIKSPKMHHYSMRLQDKQIITKPDKGLNLSKLSFDKLLGMLEANFNFDGFDIKSNLEQYLKRYIKDAQAPDFISSNKFEIDYKSDGFIDADQTISRLLESIEFMDGQEDLDQS